MMVLTKIWQPSDEHADTQTGVDGVHGCLNAFQRLKQQRPQLKTILSVGGGGNGSAPFAGVARSPEARKTFAASAKRLVDAYHFDGIDIDWEHPENPSQGADYVSLLKALRESLTAPKYLVTTALPAGEWALRNIDLKKAQSSLDYINLMAYDFSGPWTSTSGHQSQLYAPPQAPPESQSSGGSAVAYMKSKGVPSNKILLGIPVYGRSFLGASQINQKFTGSGGHEGTFEYRELPRPGAQEQFDQHAVAAFCVGGDGGFVSYDNPRTVELKAQFAKREKLAGLFYWTGTGDKNGSESLVAAGHRVLCS
ncbi:MAG: hypothetical protein LQ342_007087 [Letrouitia transgressa]|nr:MAG: hypothetical protein LQ342_007087 [Letrouitia transgressa]